MSIFKRRKNEDETFKALRGATYEEMLEILGREYRRNHKGFRRFLKEMVGRYSDQDWIDERDRLYQKYGWTHEKFIDEQMNRVLRRALSLINGYPEP